MFSILVTYWGSEKSPFDFDWVIIIENEEGISIQESLKRSEPRNDLGLFTDKLRNANNILKREKLRVSAW